MSSSASLPIVPTSGAQNQSSRGILSRAYNVVRHPVNTVSSTVSSWIQSSIDSTAAELPQVIRQNISTLPATMQAAASLIAKQVADPILQYRSNGTDEGIDLNILHWTPDSSSTSVPSPSSLPSPTSSPSLTSVPSALPPSTPLALEPVILPPPAATLPASTTPNKDTDTAEMNRYTEETKKEARKKLYPILQVYAQVQIILSDLKGVSSDIIDECVNEAVREFTTVKPDGSVETDIRIDDLKKMLEKKGVKLTFSQRCSMSWKRSKLYIFGIFFNFLLSSSLDMMLSKAYSQLFGENGKNQTTTLREITGSLSSFFGKYLKISKNFRKDETYRATGNTENDFIAEMIRTEKFLSTKSGRKLNEQELFSEFSIEKLRLFIKNDLKFYFGVTENTSLFNPFKWGYLISYGLAWIITWLLDDTIAENTTKVVDSVIKNIIDPNTQYTLKKNTLALLKEFKTELQRQTEPKPAAAALNFQSAKDPLIHDNIRNLAKNAAELLKLELPRLKIEKDTPLEKILQLLPNNYGEVIISEIFNKAMQSVIPGALLSGFEKFLHPSEVHRNMVDVIQNTAEALRSPKVAITKEQEQELDIELEKTLGDLSEAILKNVIKEQLGAQLNTVKDSYARGFVPPKINIDGALTATNARIQQINVVLAQYNAEQATRYSISRALSRTPANIATLIAEKAALEKKKTELEKQKSNKYDIEEIVLHSLKPRLSNLLKRAINLAGNENIVRGMIYQVMAQVV